MEDSLLLYCRLSLCANEQTNIVVMEMIDVISDANKHLGDAGDPSMSLDVLMCASLVDSRSLPAARSSISVGHRLMVPA